MPIKRGIVKDCGPDCWLTQDPQPRTQALQTHENVAIDLPDPKVVSQQLYRQLGSWQTRIIQLEPGGFPDPLDCKLLTEDIIHFEGVAIRETFEVVQYEALSYAWGRQEFTHNLHCNGVVYPVTQNLAIALRNLRLSYVHRYLWVDAICINQHDDAEKATQIGNMFLIYQKAKRVVAWLGDELEWTFRAFELAKKQYYLLNTFHLAECIVQFHRACLALKELIKRPWFSRTWVRQEVFAGRKVVLRCGTCEMDFYCLSRCSDWFKKALEIAGLTEIAESSGEDLEDALTRLKVLERGPSLRPHVMGSYNAVDALLNTLSESAFFQATDPRDLVYGVLGIASNINGLKAERILKIPNEPSNHDLAELTMRQVQKILKQINQFSIDYSKSISEVYQEVIRFSIRNNRDLSVLFIWERQHKRASELPSWVTDWRQPLTVSPFYLDDLHWKRRTVRPLSRGSACGAKGGVLQLTGFRIGPLTQILGSSRTHTSTWNGMKSWRIRFSRALRQPRVDLHGAQHYMIWSVDPLFHFMQHEGSNGIFKEGRLELSIPKNTVAEKGDLVVLFLGAFDACLIRPASDGQFFFVGPVMLPFHHWERKVGTNVERSMDSSKELHLQKAWVLRQWHLTLPAEEFCLV